MQVGAYRLGHRAFMNRTHHHNQNRHLSTRQSLATAQRMPSVEANFEVEYRIFRIAAGGAFPGSIGTIHALWPFSSTVRWLPAFGFTRLQQQVRVMDFIISTLIVYCLVVLSLFVLIGKTKNVEGPSSKHGARLP
jgi:hypothetical protein